MNVVFFSSTMLTSGDLRKHVWSATMLEVFDEFGADSDDVLGELEEVASSPQHTVLY